MEKGRRLIVPVFVILLLCFTSVSVAEHFVLVHGGCLGAWSWYKLIPLLKSAGHTVTAIDLAASGINLLHYNDIQNFSNSSQPLIDFMASVPSGEKVILVGHSYGGAAVAQMSELFPEKISVGVYLTALMPGPSFPLLTMLEKILPLAAALDNQLIYDDGPENPPTAFLFGPNYLSQVAFQRSPPEDAALGSVLVRPQRLVTGQELVFTEAKYGMVKRVFIVAENDRVLPADLQEWIISQNPPNKVLKIGGSDHMVMASQPQQLLANLQAIARDFS